MRDVAFVYGAIEAPWPGMGRCLFSLGGMAADVHPPAGSARPTCLSIYSATARGVLPPIQDCAHHFWRVVRDDAIGAALDDGITRLVEVGGRPSLQGFIESEAAARGLSLASLPTMERDRPLRVTMDETLAALDASVTST